jgi:tetratricopeptide (TPR) repeat protein
MLKKFQVVTYCWLLIGLLGVPFGAFGQDLGSSSGLFNKPKPKTTPKKNTAPKPKNTLVSKKTAPLPKPPAKRAARVKTPPNKPKTAPPKITQVAVQETPKPPITAPQNNLVITIGDKTSGDFDEFFEKAIEEGNAARDARQYTKAEAAYLRAQSLKTKDSRAVYGLGNLYSDQQRWEEAERAYRTAIEIEPNSTESHIALSFVLTQPIIGGNLSQRYAEAEKLARRAIEIEPNNALAYDQLGVALELRREYFDPTVQKRRPLIAKPSKSNRLSRSLTRISRSCLELPE